MIFRFYVYLEGLVAVFKFPPEDSALLLANTRFYANLDYLITNLAYSTTVYKVLATYVRIATSKFSLVAVFKPLPEDSTLFLGNSRLHANLEYFITNLEYLAIVYSRLSDNSF